MKPIDFEQKGGEYDYEMWVFASEEVACAWIDSRLHWAVEDSRHDLAIGRLLDRDEI